LGNVDRNTHEDNGDGAKRFYPWVKETFNIPVEDLIDACEFSTVVAMLQKGSEYRDETVEVNRERAVGIVTKCAWNEMFNELEIAPELRGGCVICTVWVGEGIKAVNPKITVKRTKAMQSGDPYCEFIWEFKEE
jgi:hypothetical protein